MPIEWFVIAIIAFAAAIGMFLPVWRNRRPQSSRAEYDLSVYQDQIAELHREARQGLIGTKECVEAEYEIQRRMLRIAEMDSGSVASQAAPRGYLLPALGFLTAIGAMAVYAVFGMPGVPDFPYAGRKIAIAAGDRPAPHGPAGETVSINDMIERLQVRLAAQPGDAKGWFLLGRSLKSLKRYEKAIDAFRRAMSLSNGHPAVAIEFAETIVTANDNTVIKEAKDAFVTVLAADARNIRARYFIGLAFAQEGDLSRAIQYWVDLLALSPSDAPWTQNVREQIAFASKEAKLDANDFRPSAEVARLVAAGDSPGQPALSTGPLASANADELAMIRAMVERLARRLETTPEDADGWSRLARAYHVLGEKKLAEDAQERAAELRASATQ